MDRTARIRPSLWNCLWGVPFFLFGAGVFAYTTLHGIMHVTDSLSQIVVPGSAELHLDRGRYTVFLEEESVVNGKIYSTTESVSGLACRVNPVQSGSPIPIGKSDTNITYSVNGRSGHAVLQFAIERAGEYRFACDYGEGTNGPKVVVAVGSGVGEAISSTVIVGLAAFFGGGGAGVVVILIVVLLREREKKRLRQLGQTTI